MLPPPPPGYTWHCPHCNRPERAYWRWPQFGCKCATTPAQDAPSEAEVAAQQAQDEKVETWRDRPPLL